MYIVNASHSNVTANIYKKSDKNKKTNDFYYNCSEKSRESYTNAPISNNIIHRINIGKFIHSHSYPLEDNKMTTYLGV